MKKIILSILILLSISLINAQSLVSMTDQEFTFSSGSKEAIKVTFKDVNAENVSFALKEYFKNNYKAKTSAVRKTDDEYEVEDFKATDIQQKLTAALVRIIEIEGDAIMYIHYKSDGYVVSEKNTPELYPAYKKLTQNVVNQAIALTYESQLALRKKELAEQENILAGFVKTEEKNSAEIAKMNSANKTTEETLSRLEADLSKQKSVVIEKAKLVSEKETEIATVDVKSIKKEIKKVESSNKKADKTISKTHGKIANYQAKIKTLESSIESIEETKIANNNHISELQTKLSAHNEEGLENQLKLLEKDSKDAISEEKSITKSIDKERATIEKNKLKINAAQMEIAAAKVSQAAKTAEISKINETIKILESKVTILK